MRGSIHGLAILPSILAIIAVTGSGCRNNGAGPWSTTDSATTEVPRPALVDGVFPTAEASIAETPVPQRFGRELPSSVASFPQSWKEYPAVHIQKRLCAGDEQMRERFVRAVTAAGAAGARPQELRSTYGPLLDGCGRPESCSWAQEAQAVGGAVAEVAWVALARCGEQVESLFEAAGAPAEPTIEYWSRRSWQEDFTARFVPAMAVALVQVAREEDPWLTRRAAVLLSEGGDPRSAETLLSLHDELPEGETRDALIAAMGDLPDPRARKLFEDYCARPRQQDPVCGNDWGEDLGEGESPSPAAGCLDRENLKQALAAAEMEAVYGVADCLSWLAGSNRAAAVAEAERLLSWEIEDSHLRRLAESLVAFPEPGALEAKLRSLGLIPRGPLPSVEEPIDSSGLSPLQVLVGSGPVHCFDVETGWVPNEHHALLYDLAALAGDPLAAAVFEELPPPIDIGSGRWLVNGQEVDRLPEGIRPGDAYRLRAYLGGYSYGVDAEDFGDWYDLDQVLGLLNAMAVHQGASAGFTTVPTGDQSACVLVAPRDAILAGIREGLLEIAAAGDAMAQGQVFEETVLEQLRSGEIELD